MKKKKSLSGRWLRNTLSIVLSLVLFCVIALSLTVAIYRYSAVKTELEEKVGTGTRLCEAYADRSYDEYYAFCGRFVRSYAAKENMELQFIDKDCKVVASSYELPADMVATGDVLEALENKESCSFSGKDPTTGLRIMAVSSPLVYEDGEVIGVLRYVTVLSSVDRQIALFVLLAAFVGFVLLIIIYASGRYYLKSILEPVSEITATAKRIAAGTYGIQIQKKSEDEIGELAETINDMSNKISQAEKMQSEFVSSVSHELRTPLTAISGWSETLLSAGGSVETTEARRGLSIILRESKRLTGMVEELLEFTRIQDGRFTLNVSLSDIRGEFEDTVFMYGSRLEQEQIELVYLENDDDIPEILCDTARMRQVFLNILDNAAKHGGEGGKITAEICQEDQNVVIRIRDFGQGIPEEEIPLVKKKFYKGTSKARGSGIGLAVCEEIVTMHNGVLLIENAAGGGTLVTIRLPIAQG